MSSHLASRFLFKLSYWLLSLFLHWLLKQNFSQTSPILFDRRKKNSHLFNSYSLIKSMYSNIDVLLRKPRNPQKIENHIFTFLDRGIQPA